MTSSAERLFELDAPPDAGATYLGAYGLTNAWACWLIGRAPEIVADSVSRASRAESPPRCPMVAGWLPCNEPMLLRPGYWCCYRHGEPVRLKVRPNYERAPDGDVLALVGR